MSRAKTTEARLDIFIRIVGLVFLFLGISLTFFVATTPLHPQLSPVYYLISVLFILSGLIALTSKLA